MKDFDVGADAGCGAGSFAALRMTTWSGRGSLERRPVRGEEPPRPACGRGGGEERSDEPGVRACASDVNPKGGDGHVRLVAGSARAATVVPLPREFQRDPHASGGCAQTPVRNTARAPRPPSSYPPKRTPARS